MWSRIGAKARPGRVKLNHVKRHLHLSKRHVEPTEVSLHGIVGKLHMPATSRKIHIADDALAKSYAKSKSYVQKGKHVKGLSGVNIKSLQASLSGPMELIPERGLVHMSHHMSVLIDAFAGGTMPTVNQVQSVEKKYMDYFDFCIRRNQKI